MFLEKGVLKIYSKFTGESLCRRAISIKLQSNSIEITLRHRCSLVNLLHNFRTPFSENTSGGLLLQVFFIWSIYQGWKQTFMKKICSNNVKSLLFKRSLFSNPDLTKRNLNPDLTKWNHELGDYKTISFKTLIKESLRGFQRKKLLWKIASPNLKLCDEEDSASSVFVLILWNFSEQLFFGTPLRDDFWGIKSNCLQMQFSGRLLS